MEYLTVKQAAQILGCNVSKIYNHIQKAELASKEIYEKIVVPRDEVYALKKEDDELRILWCTVKKYAMLNHITAKAVYLRIEAGTLESRKHNGTTYVKKEIRYRKGSKWARR